MKKGKKRELSASVKTSELNLTLFEQDELFKWVETKCVPEGNGCVRGCMLR